jgi:hypothetical protein
VFSLGIFPKETLHLFAGHEDTQCSRTDKCVLDARHHHCEILSLAIPVFAGASVQPVLFSQEFTTHVYVVQQVNAAIGKTALTLSLRGPPQA